MKITSPSDGHGRSSLVLAAAAERPLSPAVYPQAGFEMYLGANRLRLWKPWVALRFSLSDNASLLLKYYHHGLSYDYSVYLGRSGRSKRPGRPPSPI